MRAVSRLFYVVSSGEICGIEDDYAGVRGVEVIYMYLYKIKVCLSNSRSFLQRAFHLEQQGATLRFNEY